GEIHMRVHIAKAAGICMGVRRAMNAVLDAAHKSDQPISTLGPLVHNKQAMEMLATKNVKVVSSSEEAGRGILFIRAHGVTPAVKDSLARPDLEVQDMTCPHVRRAQKIIERHAREGYHTLIIGDAGHAEVVGLLGHADGRGYVVDSEEDINALPAINPVCVVAQTTQNARRFKELLPVIEARFPGAAIFNTVCSATDDRQNEVHCLAHEVDCIIVVGGRHSANTVRLAEIAGDEGVPTFHIETADELNPSEIRRFATVGITAGASTPHWVFKEVVTRVDNYLEPRTFFVRHLRALLLFFVHAYLYIGAGSAAMTYAALRLLDIPPRFSYLLLSFMYVVSMHIFNRFTDVEASKLNHPLRMSLMLRYRGLFMATASVFAAATLFLAYPFGTYPFLLMLTCLVAGMVYSRRLIPIWLARKIRFKTFREIPGSKDIFIAMAWSTVTVLLPYLAETEVPSLPAIYAFLFCFIMVFLRSLVYDMQDIEGDRIIGKETFPLIMGPRHTTRLIFYCAGCLALIALTDIFPGWSALSGYLLLPVVLYICFYLILYYRRFFSQGILFEIAVDAQFILTGLLAFCIPHTI
ncbi:MAG: 4-hydroxy-3-methylbut-2-enyl diphosphate reductase, partial [Planctomycetota bacterium]